MPAQFSLPPDTRAVGTGNPPADMNAVVDALTAMGAGFNALNAAFAGGGDPTGVADSAPALQAMLAATVQGTQCTLPAGTFRLKSPLVMGTKNVTLQGFGLGNTDKTGSTVLLIDAAFSGNAAISVTAPGCQVQNLCIMGSSTTTTSNPIANGLEITGAKFSNIQNLFMQYINGWGIESAATATVPNIGTSVYNVTIYNSAGGIHILGVTGTAFQAQHSLIDLQLSQIGVSTGANANLDAILLEDCQDILTLNTNCAVSNASTGSTLHIKGACATHTHANLDLGVFPAAGTVNNVIKIEDSAGGSPTQLTFSGGVAQAGQRAMVISGGANQLVFENMWFKNNLTDGVQLSGTGTQVDFRNCTWGLNGQGATGTNYDLNASGSSTGSVRGCYFNSPVVAALSVGVQQVVNIGAAGQDIQFTDDQFLGTGSIISTIFGTLPSVIRGCRNYNPHGAVAGPPAMPATTVASTALHYDSVAYITAGTASVSVVRNAGGFGGGASPAITIPAAACLGIFVPARTTWTPTYASGSPTLVVDGL